MINFIYENAAKLKLQESGIDDYFFMK